MPIMQSPPGAETTIDGRRYLYFAGTGYLGLQGHPQVIHAACEAAERYGIGSATTRAWFGNMPPTLDVERQAARFFATEEAFYTVSGYVGNHILVAWLANACDALFVDEGAHYSVREAARLAGKPIHQFRHRDPQSLAEKLMAKLSSGQRPVALSDGVFSVLGSIAPVEEYRQVLGRYPGSVLVLDDAHAVGVLGEHGRGTFEHVGLWDEVNSLGRTPSAASQPQLLVGGTLSKALGGFGGIIPGSQAFLESLKGASHYFEGASPPPAPAAAASARALELVMSDPDIRRRLRDNVAAVKQGLARLGLPTDDSPVPIVCLRIGTAANMQRIQRALAEQGILIAYAAAYSGVGPEGALRLAVFSTHTPPMIQALLDCLAGLL